MDAQAHLVSLGWAGPGHSLDARPYKQKGHRGLAYDPQQVRATGNGLVKPLLISQRSGRLGIGKKAHEPQAGNEWWLKGFETALGNIGKPKSEESSGTATPDSINYKGKHAGLYGFFVKGQEMQGTIGKSKTTNSRKRKSDRMEDTSSSESDSTTSTSQGRDPLTSFQQVGEFFEARDKGRQQRSKHAKAEALEEFQRINEFFEATEDDTRRKHKSKSRKSDVKEPDEEDDPSEQQIATEEYKELRRKRRKGEKASKSDDSPKPDLNSFKSHTDELSKEAARKAERKRIKSRKVISDDVVA